MSSEPRKILLSLELWIAFGIILTPIGAIAGVLEGSWSNAFAYSGGIISLTGLIIAELPNIRSATNLDFSSSPLSNGVCTQVGLSLALLGGVIATLVSVIVIGISKLCS